MVENFFQSIAKYFFLKTLAYWSENTQNMHATTTNKHIYVYLSS